MKHNTKLALIRKYRGMTAEDLSSASGVNIWTIKAYENKRRNINNASVKILKALSDTLNCEVENLLEKKREEEQ